MHAYIVHATGIRAFIRVVPQSSTVAVTRVNITNQLCQQVSCSSSLIWDQLAGAAQPTMYEYSLVRKFEFYRYGHQYLSRS